MIEHRRRQNTEGETEGERRERTEWLIMAAKLSAYAIVLGEG